MRTLLYNWHLMRILRLAVGIAVIMHGISLRETMSVVLGIIVGGMALANIGCCNNKGCSVSPRSGTTEKRIDYEELDTKK